MESFSELKNLISRLKPWEIEPAERFLTAFELNYTVRKNKSLKLFRIMLTNHGITWHKAKRVIIPNADNRSFGRLVYRLKEKLLEFLLLDINVKNPEGYSELYQNWFSVRKMLMQSHILIGRGLEKESNIHYEKIYKKARKYEFFEELIEVLHLIQRYNGLRKGIEAFEKNDAEIAFFERCRTSVHHAKKLWYKYFICEVDFVGHPNKKQKFLMETIANLKKDYAETKASYPAYFLTILIIEFHIVKGEYELACLCCKDLVKLIRNNPVIFMKRRLANAYSDLADNELFIFDFNSSIDHARQSLNGYDCDDYNYKISREIEFKALFYSGNTSRCSAILRSLLSSTRPDELPFLYNKWLYFKACVFFVTKKFKLAFHQLEAIKELDKNREGWGFGVRLLTILCLIELGLNDMAEDRIEALRKYCERLNSKYPLHKREIVMLNLLQQLVKKSFLFCKTLDEQSNRVQSLNTIHGDLGWEVKSYEMIPFHLWVEAKARGSGKNTDSVLLSEGHYSQEMFVEWLEGQKKPRMDVRNSFPHPATGRKGMRVPVEKKEIVPEIVKKISQ